MSPTTIKPVFNLEILRPATLDAVRKLHPRVMVKNPVMFVVEIGSVLTTMSFLIDQGFKEGRAFFDELAAISGTCGRNFVGPNFFII